MLQRFSTAKKQTRRSRRSYPPEFKTEVVAFIRSGGHTVPQVARDLDLTALVVRAWVMAADPKESTLADNPESEELKQLRADNKQLRMERNIPVQATAYFDKEST